jgi:hypothetical protein
LARRGYEYDREAFLADKDQLYAEAVVCEPAEKLWLDTPGLVAAHERMRSGACGHAARVVDPPLLPAEQAVGLSMPYLCDLSLRR